MAWTNLFVRGGELLLQRIFITGSTGFLGWHLVKRLIRKSDNNLVLLAREANALSAEERIDTLLKRDYKGAEYHRVKGQIEVIKGDIAEDILGLDKKNYHRLSREIDIIFHCAALCDFDIPWDRIRRINVGGTKNILDLAFLCNKGNGKFEGLHHISTVGVAGKKSGVFYENDLDIGQEFNNTYEKSKFDAEKLVSSYRHKGVAITVYRPSAIVGNSVTGEATNFQVIYQPLHILSQEIYEEIPAKPNVKFNLVPVDYAVEAIYLISSKKKDLNQTYHIVNTNEITFEAFIETASKYFGFKKPGLIPIEEFNMENLQGFRRKLLAPYLPYFNRNELKYDAANLNKSLKGSSFAWPVIDEKLLFRLFKFCKEAGYIVKKE
ncbi:MAG: SDR family oxidoreductase [Nitrospinota bacterium]